MRKIKEYKINNCKITVQINSYLNTELKVRKGSNMKIITMSYVDPTDLIECLDMIFDKEGDLNGN